MGRDPSCPPGPDSRGNPGAVLYETQKVATVEVIGQTPGAWSLLCYTRMDQEPQQVTDSKGEYGIRDIAVRESLVLCTC